MTVRIEVAADIAAAARDKFVSLGRAAIAAHGRFNVALAGGSTPRGLYELLQPADLDWSRVGLFFGDERCVPLTDERSNFAMAKAAMFDRIPDARAHPLQDPKAYEALLRATLQPAGHFDLILLGMGPDGHIASLFPGSPALAERDRWVVAAPAGLAPFVERLTLTPPMLQRAETVLVLVSGEAKAEVVRQVLQGPPGQFPAQLLAQASGQVDWLLDAPAASRLDLKQI